MVTENFLPARLHPREDAADYRRYSAQYGANWTPTILWLDPEGIERHRVEGFLPKNDLLAQLNLGLGHLAFRAEDWQRAQDSFREVVDQFAETDAAPEAQYWLGVTLYKATGDAGALERTAEAFAKRYSDSVWAKKASVWEPSHR